MQVGRWAQGSWRCLRCWRGLDPLAPAPTPCDQHASLLAGAARLGSRGGCRRGGGCGQGAGRGQGARAGKRLQRLRHGSASLCLCRRADGMAVFTGSQLAAGCGRSSRWCVCPLVRASRPAACVPPLQVAVAAAVAEKDAQLHAAQEALRQQLQQQLQQAEAELEVGACVNALLAWRNGMPTFPPPPACLHAAAPSLPACMPRLPRLPAGHRVGGHGPQGGAAGGAAAPAGGSSAGSAGAQLAQQAAIRPSAGWLAGASPTVFLPRLPDACRPPRLLPLQPWLPPLARSAARSTRRCSSGARSWRRSLLWRARKSRLVWGGGGGLPTVCWVGAAATRY